MGIKWKKSDRVLLRAQLEAGVNWRNAIVPGRTTESIRRHARRYNLVPKERHPAITEEQKKELRRLKTQRFLAREISEFDLLGLPHRTANTVQKILGKIRLVNKNRSRAAKNRKRWLNGEKQKFDNFLRKNSSRLAPQQLAKMFAVVEATVTARQRFLGVKTSLAETMTIPYFKKKNRKLNWQKSRKMLLGFEKYIIQKERRLEALAQKLWGQKRLVELREKCCGNCKKIWPKHKKFFFHATYKTSFGTSWHFCRNCVVCAAKYRHKKKVAKYEKKYSQKLE